jgi:hypothetical protein
VVDHGLVVNIMNVPDIHVIHRTVVVEGAMIPISALVANTSISKAIIHTAIKADVFAPVAAMPGVRIIAPAPIPRSPEEANFWSHHPGSRHPEVTFISITPIAWGP